MTHQRSKLIFLLGFMGSGKSTVGALLAHAMGWPFIDLDTTIEAGQGQTIREIFDHAGEAFFRSLEHAALTEAAKSEPAVIALGGGTFVQEPNFQFIRDRGGATVWLDSPVEELAQRCATMNNRPLFKDQETFRQLLQQRLPYYQQAEFRVSTGGHTPQEVMEKILSLRIF